MIHTLYINLEQRSDRNTMMKNQFRDISGIINLERMNAIHNPTGLLGCVLSHIECVEHAKKMNWDSVLILEDDFELIVPPIYFLNRIKLLLSKSWDVMLLTGFVRTKVMPKDEMCKIDNTQAACGYIVRSHYYDTLLKNFRDGYTNLVNTKNEPVYAIDQYWKNLQKVDSWYISCPILGKQRPGFSDIVKKSVNYDDYFLKSSFNKGIVPKTL